MKQKESLTLKEREQEVLLLTSFGLEGEDMHAQLNICVKTIDIYSSSLMDRFCATGENRNMKLVIHKAWVCGLMPQLMKKYENRFGELMAVANKVDEVDI